MFHYDAWLQTSPPLFLLLVRLTVLSLGATNWTLRLIPLLFGVLAAVLMFQLARITLAPRFARAAWALFVLSPLAISFSRTLKQFSAELAVSTALLLTCCLYLQRGTDKRFRLLLATAAVGPLVAYSSAFLLPPVVLLVWLAGERPGPKTFAPRGHRWRAPVLAAVWGGMLLGVYVFCVRPNTSASLHAYWADDRSAHNFARNAVTDAYSLVYDLPVPRPVLHSTVVRAGVAIILLAGLALSVLRYRHGRRKWLEIQALCGVPWFLLTVCSALGLYPVNERMGLFLLPAVALLLTCDSQLIAYFLLRGARRRRLVPVLDSGLAVLVALLLVVSAIRQPIHAAAVPLEDMSAAVSFLKGQFREGDRLWVHASGTETFKLYQHLDGWTNAPVQSGHTGWPCCPRGVVVLKGSGREADVRADINTSLPSGFAGRVWLVYTTRPEHWSFVGIDESQVLDHVFVERGCVKGTTPVFYGIGVGLYDCGTGARDRPIVSTH